VKEMVPMLETLIDSFCNEVKSANEFIKLEEETKMNSNFSELEYDFISIDFESSIFPSENLFETKFSEIFSRKQSEFIRNQFKSLTFEISQEYESEIENVSVGEYLWNKPIYTVDELISIYKQRMKVERSNPYSIYNQSVEKNYSIQLNVLVQANTKNTQRVCEAFYQNFKLIVEDVSSFIVKERMNKKNQKLESVIYECIYQYIHEICDIIEMRLKKTKNPLFFGRICQSIKNCVIGVFKDLNYGIFKKNNFHERLDQLNKESHQEWIKETSELFKNSIVNFKYDENEFIDIWTETTIGGVEENEKEVLKIPGIPCKYIHESLLLTCTRIYNLAGYSIEQFILDSLIERMTQDLFESYLEKQEEHSENVYLQLIFDFLFLGELFFGVPFNKLTRRTNGNIEKIYIQLMNQLIQKIDPINYQVFESEIMKNVSLNVQRSCLLFSPLTSVKKLDEKFSSQEEVKPILKLNPIVEPFPLLSIPKENKIHTSPKMEKHRIVSPGSPTSGNNLEEMKPSSNTSNSGMFGSFVNFFNY
jgi:hypothetical protein